MRAAAVGEEVPRVSVLRTGQDERPFLPADAKGDGQAHVRVIGNRFGKESAERRCARVSELALRHAEYPSTSDRTTGRSIRRRSCVAG